MHKQIWGKEIPKKTLKFEDAERNCIDFGMFLLSLYYWKTTRNSANWTKIMKRKLRQQFGKKNKKMFLNFKHRVNTRNSLLWCCSKIVEHTQLAWIAPSHSLEKLHNLRCGRIPTGWELQSGGVNSRLTPAVTHRSGAHPHKPLSILLATFVLFPPPQLIAFSFFSHLIDSVSFYVATASVAILTDKTVSRDRWANCPFALPRTNHNR